MMAYMGDGATSASDFHSSLTFAGVWKAPVVFVCQNNHWSISVPTEKQTAAKTIASKAKGYGMPGIKIDGNNALEVYAATKAAVDRARRGEGPTLIEAETYRLGAHSSSDDPSRYRDEREVESWRKRDPIAHLKSVLLTHAQWDETQDQTLRDTLLLEINKALAEAEAAPDPEPSVLFEDVYARLRWHLEEQKREMFASL